MRVAARVISAGGTTDEVYAALLHDVLEDADAKEHAAVQVRVAAFGPIVDGIVAACSDAAPSDGPKGPWLGRKTAHLEHLRAGVLPEAYLVLAADKLDAVERLVTDAKTPPAFWEREIFKGGRLGTIWYYRSMAAIVDDRLGDHALAVTLRAATDRLTTIAHCDGRSLDEILADAKTRPYPDGIKDGEK
jgi:(p)ppGpp synthase/HD superfamily hydrolase